MKSPKTTLLSYLTKHGIRLDWKKKLESDKIDYNNMVETNHKQIQLFEIQVIIVFWKWVSLGDLHESWGQSLVRRPELSPSRSGTRHLITIPSSSSDETVVQESRKNCELPYRRKKNKNIEWISSSTLDWYHQIWRYHDF